MPQDIVEYDYRPSDQARLFHASPHRYRILVWGIQAGKSVAGGVEMAHNAMDHPGAFCWTVAPTYGHLQVCERVLNKIFSDPVCEGWVTKHNLARHEFHLANGSLIQMKSAEWPEALRGPPVDFAWVDEGAIVKAEAWWILKERVAATRGHIWVTTSPVGRNWIWDEVKLAGMPANAPYGQWGDAENKRWCSHYPTWDFPWVTEADIKDFRRSMPRAVFDQDFGAKFLSAASSVFRYIEEALSWAALIRGPDDKVVLGVDLAKHQDWTAMTAMDGAGRVLWVERWTGIDWKIQEARLIGWARKLKAAIILDRSNVGSVFEERLRGAGVIVYPVDMNSAQVKQDLIQALQVAFELKNLKLPHPRSQWAPSASKDLIDELQWYQSKLTKGGRIGYSAPKGLHDDLVVSLALANWGRMRGLAGGGFEAADASIELSKLLKMEKNKLRLMRPKIFRKIFGRRSGMLGSALGESGGPFWR